MSKNALHDPVWFTPPDGSSRVLLKDSPSAPPAPDYTGAATATAAGNLDAARYATNANRVNQYSPFGSSTYSQADPNDPNSRWTQNINLSQTGQSLLDSLNQSQLGVSGLQAGATDAVRNTMGTPFNYNGPQIQGSVSQPWLQTSLGALPGVQTGVSSPDLQTSISNPGVQSAVGTYGQQSSVANPNVQTSFADVGGLQRGFDPGGQQQQALTNVGGPQRGLDFSGAPRLPGVNDFGRERDLVTNALLSRSEPQFARDEELTRTRLINQGLAPGSQASDYDLDTLNRSRNDARMQATLAGSQEQSRLFGLASQARGQYTGEQAQQGQFANNAQNQAFGQGLASGQFANQAQQNQYGQNLGAMQATNAAQSQAYAQEQARAQFANQAAGQQFGQNLSAANLYNNASMNQFQQGLASGQFANQAAAQQFGQNLGAGQFANAAAGQQFGQGVTNANLYNAGNAQQFGQGLQAAQFGNQASGQQFNQGLAAGQFQNTAAQNALAQQMALYNQPLNALSALRSGSQVTTPQFGNVPQQQTTAGPNYSGATQAQGAWDQGLYNQNVSQNNSFNSGLMSLAGTAAMFMSDRRLKSNIVRIADHPLGVGIYEYDIFGKRDVGVMADEVLAVRPEAVSLHPSGFMQVDYGRL